MRPASVFLSGLWLSVLLLSAVEPRNITDDDAPVKVFFLVGQSNMEGKGNPIHLDTYKSDPLIQPTYASLKSGAQLASA